MRVTVRFADGSEKTFEHAKEDLGIEPKLAQWILFNEGGQIIGRFSIMHVQGVYYPDRDSSIITPS